MGTGGFSAASGYYLEVNAYMISQNVGGNFSTIYWQLDVVKSTGAWYYSSAMSGNYGSADSSAGGLWSAGNLSYDFRSGSRFNFGGGTFNVQHRPDGNAEFYVNGSMTLVNMGTASAGTGWIGLPQISTTRVPDPTTPQGLDNFTQTSIRYRFSGNFNGGTPILEYQIGYSTDPNVQYWTMSSGGLTDVGGLKPATRYYFWSRARNSVGWGPWSPRTDARTIAGARVKANGVWKEAIPYVKVNGIWRLAQPHVKTNGLWKKSV